MNKLMKKSVLLILTLLVLLAVGSVAAYAAPTQDENGVYQISSEEELYWIAGLVNGDKSIIGEDTQQNADACAELVNDIVIQTGVLDEDGSLNSGTFEEWTPIGSYGEDGEMAYTGTFDGNEHTISGLYCDIVGNSNRTYAGLFGYSSGTIQNVKIADSYISADVGYLDYSFVYAGSVCGYNNGGTLTNCSNSATVSAEGGDEAYAGGICGYNNGVTITNCSNSGEISAKYADTHTAVGGICGYNDFGKISNCSNSGKVSAESTGVYVNAGGICGYKDGGEINNCFNSEEVSATATSTSGSIDLYVTAGGICGHNYGTIINCYNTGKVSGSGSNSAVGGVCGWNRGTITNCYFLQTDGLAGIGNSSGEATPKEQDQFASGEVAWLLNDGQESKSWGHGSNNLPVLKDNLPDGVTAITPVRITIVMPNESKSYGYTTEESTLAEYPSGYAFFEDEKCEKMIDIATKIYGTDTTIYAAKAVESISLDKTELYLYVKGTEQLTATIESDNVSVRILVWSSSDPEVAIVDQNGKVTAVSKGTAVITAEAADGQGAVATCTVTVKNRSGIVPQKTLTFDTNGGSEIDAVRENYGKTIVLADYTPKRSGCEFLSWYKDEKLTEKSSTSF